MLLVHATERQDVQQQIGVAIDKQIPNPLASHGMPIEA